jgi:hypothetical protein
MHGIKARGFQNCWLRKLVPIAVAAPRLSWRRWRRHPPLIRGEPAVTPDGSEQEGGMVTCATSVAHTLTERARHVPVAGGVSRCSGHSPKCNRTHTANESSKRHGGSLLSYTIVCHCSRRSKGRHHHVGHCLPLNCISVLPASSACWIWDTGCGAASSGTPV